MAKKVVHFSQTWNDRLTYCGRKISGLLRSDLWREVTCKDCLSLHKDNEV